MLSTARAALETPAKLASASRGDGTRGAFLGQLEPLRAGVVEQILALLTLARGAQEQPTEQPECEEGLLDHHDCAGDVLVGERRDVMHGVAVGVEGVEDGPGPEEDVAEDGAGKAHGDDVEQTAEVAEP